MLKWSEEAARKVTVIKVTRRRERIEVPRPTDDEIQALAARVSAAAGRILAALQPLEAFMGGGAMDCDGSPVCVSPDGKPEVTFCAYSGNANAFYRWNADEPLPLTPEELGAALAGVMIGDGARPGPL